MSGIFKTIDDSEIILYADFRDGTFVDKSGNYTIAKSGTINLNNTGAVMGTTSQFTCANVAIGTGDFTQIVSAEVYSDNVSGEQLRTLSGASATNRGIHIYLGAVIVRIDGTSYTDVGTDYALGKKMNIAVTADRDGDLTYFQDGLEYGTPDDISAKSAYDLTFNGTLFTEYGADNRRKAYYQLIVNRVLTESEVAQLTAELEAIKFPKKTIGRAKADNEPGNPKANEIADGDMETAGVGDWTPISSAILSKQTSSLGGGTQCIRVFEASSYASAIQQVLTVGKTYHVTGYARSDGVATPYCSVTSSASWTGTTSTDWQYFEFTATAENTYFDIYKLAVGDYAEFDDILVQEIGKTYLDVQFKTDFGALANERTITSGFIENTPFEVQSGSFKVIDDTIDGQDVKAIECVTAGIFSIPTSYFHESPTNSAYGEFEWYLKKPDASGVLIMLIADVNGAWNSSGQDGYLFEITSSEGMRVHTITNGAGAGTSLLAADGYVPINVFNKFNFTRTDAGVGTLYMNDVLVSVAGGSGSNPFTENTHTISDYMTFDLDAGDKISLGALNGDKGLLKK